MLFTKPITEIVTRRSSVRTYTKAPIDPNKESSLKTYIANNQIGPFQTKTRFQLITASPGDAKALKGLGTYGFIKNPAGFIIGSMEESGQKPLEDFGYVMEAIVLAATDLGLGTCWLGGSFRKSRFAEALAINDREIVPAVTPVGYPAEKRSLRDSLIRRSAGSDRRLPWEQLFFQNNFAAPLSKNNAGAYTAPLDMLRLAPSASNKQPWRIVKEERQNMFYFYLKRTPGYNRSEKKFFRMPDLQRVDIGIAMCHFDLTAQEQGLNGKWEVRDPGIAPLPEQTEYVVSWIGE